MLNEQIYITSIARVLINAKRTGKLDLKIIQLFNLYKYYINFTEGLNNVIFNNAIISMKKEINKLQYKYPDIICNYKTIIPDDPSNIGQVVANTAPTVDNGAVTLGSNSTYQFTVGDFVTNFADINNDNYKFLLVYPLSNSTFGDLNNGSNFTSSIIINIEGLATSTLLTLNYNRNDLTAFGPDVFNFRVSDDVVNYLYSDLKTMSVSAIADSSTNQAPTSVGDNTIYVGNRVTTILTLAMFTTQLSPPYSDPESDLIDAIRIDEISTANIGVYKINGVDIQVNDIITREDLNNNLFTHTGPNQDAINSDVFNFSARDEGSLIWID